MLALDSPRNWNSHDRQNSGRRCLKISAKPSATVNRVTPALAADLTLNGK